MATADATSAAPPDAAPIVNRYGIAVTPICFACGARGVELHRVLYDAGGGHRLCDTCLADFRTKTCAGPGCAYKPLIDHVDENGDTYVMCAAAPTSTTSGWALYCKCCNPPYGTITGDCSQCSLRFRADQVSHGVRIDPSYNGWHQRRVCDPCWIALGDTTCGTCSKQTVVAGKRSRRRYVMRFSRQPTTEYHLCHACYRERR
jgi:hypothetical protein